MAPKKPVSKSSGLPVPAGKKSPGDRPVEKSATEEKVAPPQGDAPPAQNDAPPAQNDAPPAEENARPAGDDAPPAENEDNKDEKKGDVETEPTADAAKKKAKSGSKKVTKKNNKKKKVATTIFDKTHRVEKASVEERDYLAWRNSVMTNKELAAVRRIDKLMDRAVLEARSHRNKVNLEHKAKRQLVAQKKKTKSEKNKRQRAHRKERNAKKKEEEEEAKKTDGAAGAEGSGNATAEGSGNATAEGSGDAIKEVPRADSALGHASNDNAVPTPPERAVTRSQTAGAGS